MSGRHVVNAMVILGLLATAVAAAVVVVSIRARSSSSLRAAYELEVTAALAAERKATNAESARLLTEADLVHLPTSVQKYIRVSGAVGKPLVRNLRATVRGRIRSGPDASWMDFEGEQHNVFDPPARLFYLDARMFAVPAQVFHRYVGPSATMRVTIAWTYPMVNAAGPEMNVSETVTMFNDMCWLAAGALASKQIVWQELDAMRVRGTFSNAGHSVQATLVFNTDGRLIDFVSDDRMASSPDGKSFTRMRWSTPLHDYRRFGAHLISARGEGVWHAAKGEYAYIELELLDVQYNLAPPS